LTIISGDEEAQLTTAGVLSALDPSPANVLIVDIGGGSTEYVLCVGNEVLWSASYPLGVVHLTERLYNPAERMTEIKQVTDSVFEKICKLCLSVNITPADLSLVGTAGTVTTLAALDMAMKEYAWERVNNYSLSLAALQKWYGRLTPMPPAERESLPGMEKGRGDLIIAGIEIILSLLDRLDAGQLTVSDFGILEGSLLSL
jgi:exopolyphosphatase/guanosine-5'-triphosphate,3'-diphosphate pyrophosphatase